MIKMMLTIKFRSDMTKDQARQHWRTKHRDLIAAVPGVMAYTQNLKVGEPAGEVPWDGIVELTFADEDAYRAALASEEWQATNADIPNFLDAAEIITALVEPTAIL